MTTDSGGNWSITGDYTCPAGAYVYVLALGGNPGLGGSVSNSRLALMAGLGACSSLLPTTQISIDEVTTVATVYSLAAFMSTETNVGSSSTNAIGIQNAFANIPRWSTLPAARPTRRHPPETARSRRRRSTRWRTRLRPASTPTAPAPRVRA